MNQDTIVIGKQLWQQCQVCQQLVRINKTILGSLHICLSEEEISCDNEEIDLKDLWRTNELEKRIQSGNKEAGG